MDATCSARQPMQTRFHIIFASFSCTNLSLISDVCDVHCPTLDTDSLPMRAKCRSAWNPSLVQCSLLTRIFNLDDAMQSISTQCKCQSANVLETPLLFPSFTADGPAHWEAGPASSTDAFIIAATHQHPSCLPTTQVTPLLYFLQTVKLYSSSM